MIVVSLDLIEANVEVFEGFWSGTFDETPAVGALVNIRKSSHETGGTIGDTDIPVPGFYKVLLHLWVVPEKQRDPLHSPNGVVTLAVRRARPDEVPW